MSKRMNWRRARRWQSRESKYGTNVVLPNGEVTPGWRKDDLARRATFAMYLWRQTLSQSDRSKLERLG